eukprot:m.35215 g.35215  ORF g.35215 m.35215 type:complete len:436 (-) comp8858_c0_seq1:57-1364(-)
MASNLSMLLSAASLVLLLVATSAKYSRHVSYIGHKIHRCQYDSVATNGTIGATLQDLNEKYDVMTITGNWFDVRTKSHADQLAVFSKPGIICETTVEDVEAFVQEFDKSMNMSNEKQSEEWFKEYHNYEDTIQWYEDIASEYSQVTKYVPSIATSYEGRKMPALHITSAQAPKQKYWIQCQIHAREWIVGAVCQYVVNFLVTNYLEDPDVAKILAETEIIVIPFVNPDGYAYTWNGDRLWRKNRQPNAGSNCMGTDLNRNYDERWGESGGSTNPCSDTYWGTGPWSAPETAQTSEYFTKNAPIIGAIDNHAYGQIFLRPWGYTFTDTPDENKLRECGAKMASGLQGVYGTKFTNIKVAELYVNSGSSLDWFYGKGSSTNGGVRAYGMGVELRDEGRYGFLLPPNEIVSSGQEMTMAMMEFFKYIYDNPLQYPKGE